MNEFPCKECLVSVVCNQECDKLIPNYKLINIIKISKKCPDCGNEYFRGSIFTYDPDYHKSICCTKCKHIFHLDRGYNTKLCIIRNVYIGTFYNIKFHFSGRLLKLIKNGTYYSRYDIEFLETDEENMQYMRKNGYIK